MASVLLDYFKRPEIREKVEAICASHRLPVSRQKAVADERSVFEREKATAENLRRLKREYEEFTKKGEKP